MFGDPVRIAQLWGIETSYWDVRGTQRHATPAAVERIAAALSELGPPSPSAPQADAPEEAFQGSGGREWLLAVQLYSVRSSRNWGHGDFSDLAALIDLAANAGAAGVGLNPLHALFLDRPEDASPYAPSSRLFLNPLYIDVQAVPEFPAGRMFGDRIERLRQTDTVDYTGVAAAKLEALRWAHAVFRKSADAARRRDFETFCAERDPMLARFAAFETLRRKLGPHWRDWPQELAASDDGALRSLSETDGEELEFHRFVQWIADRQLQACSERAKRRGMTVGLYIDLAVGVDPGGADAWASRGAMLRGLSVGAPPDDYNPAGQDWGLTTFNPHALTRSDFEPLRDMLRTAMRHAGAIRIDHVLGLMRLYVLPNGASAQDGAYLRYPFTAMLRVVAEESRRHSCIVIGEDLGTVPEGFRETMRAWGLWSYLVMLFEREGDGSFRSPERYPERALATFGTHDLPTFHGWMSGHDLTVKRGIGVDPGESCDDRERSRAALYRALGPSPQFKDVAAFLAATPTRLVSIAIEDVLELRDQVNIPGTVTEHPNWRARLPVAIEALGTDQRLRAIAAAFAAAGRGVV